MFQQREGDARSQEVNRTNILFFRSTFMLKYFLVAAFVMLFSGGAASAAFNEEINYQAKLADDTGATVPDGDYSITYKLYTAPTGGSAVFTEVATSTVTSGLFSYLIGSSTSLSSVDFNQTLYLGVEINGDGEMTPRKRLGAVPSAFEAQNAQTLGDIATTSFLRSDQADTIAATEASTLLTITQSGAGDIFNLFDGVTEVFTVTDGGDVAIGTSTPSDLFNVYTSAGNELAYGTNGLVLTGTKSTGALLTLTNTGTAPLLNIIDGSTNVFTILDGGNVGIGTTTPEQLLSVIGDAYFEGGITSASSSVLATVGSPSLPNIILDSTNSGDNWTDQGAYISIGEGAGEGSTAAMHMTYQGQGYGYTGAGSLDGSGIPSGGYFRFRYNTNDIFTDSAITLSGADANIALGSNYISGDGTDEGIFVDSDGNVGIGNASPSSPLDVTGSVELNGGGFGVNMTPSNGGAISLRRNGFDPYIDFYEDADEIGQIRGDYGNQSISILGAPTTTTHFTVMTGGTNVGNVGVGSSTPSHNLSVAGDAIITGALYDSTDTAGVNGYVLQTTGAGTVWVATSSLGFGNGTVTSVDASVPTGWTIANNPITTSGTLAFAYDTGYAAVLTASTTNWETAFGWGDHAAGGYLADTLTNGYVFRGGAGNTAEATSSLFIADGGNIGIGTSTPGSTLSVVGSVNFASLTGGLLMASTSGLLSTTSIGINDLSDGFNNSNNIILGHAGFAGTNGVDYFNDNNIAIGAEALDNTNTDGGIGSYGDNNIAIGRYALTANEQGRSNVAIGYNPLNRNTSGFSNIALGTALGSNTTGSFNFAMGDNALTRANASNNMAFGSSAMEFTTSGSSNIALGNIALLGNVTGNFNIAIGGEALRSTDAGSYNIGIGYQTGYDLDTAVTAGANTFIGYDTGRGVVTGINNTIIGANVTGLASALSNNIILADGAGNVRLQADSTGNIGIGTTTPGSRLTVAGSIFASGTVSLDASNPSSGFVLPGDGYLARSSWKSMPVDTGILLPMYVYPSSVYTNTAYNQVIDLKNQYSEVPLYVILNPANGAGTVTDGNYAAAIQRLKGAGAIVLGYIATGYTASSTSEMQSEIDDWITYYPDIDGIFMDEMDNTNDEATLSYYQTLTRYVHGKGLYPSIGNPGAGVAGNFFASSTADLIVTYENSSYPDEATLKGDFDNGYADYNKNQRAALAYNSSEFYSASTTLLKKYNGLIYVTDDTLPNPWDTVSPYLEETFQLLSVETDRFFTDLSVDGRLAVGTTSTSAAYLTVQSQSTTDILNLFETDGEEVFTVLENGNIGIGTTTPSSKLTVAGDAYITGALYDSTNNAGTNGYVLQTTGAGTTWVATSSLGFGTGDGSVTSVNASVPTGWTIANNPITTSGTLAFAYDTGYAAVLTASTTNWNNFFDTPSTQISAGTGLSWSGNILNAEVQSSDLASLGTDNQIPFMNGAGTDYEYSANLTYDGSKIQVLGEIWAFNDGASNRFLFGDSGTTGQYGGLQWFSGTDTLGMGLSQYSNAQLQFGTDGGVSIGPDTTPDFGLEISTSTLNGYFGISASESGPNDGGLFIVDNSGNVGIGTSTPVGRLSVTTEATQTWQEIGTELTISGIDSVSLTTLSPNRVAYIDRTNDDLRVYEFNGSTWTEIGTELPIAGVGVPVLTTLSPNRVAFVDDFNDELRVYEFDGSTWSEVGTGLSLSAFINSGLTTLSPNRVAFIGATDDNLRVYEFNGSTWTEIGTALNIPSAAAPGLTTLSPNRVAFMDSSQDDLRVYEFNGSTWKEIGTELNLAGIGKPELTTLSPNRIAFNDGSNDELRVYEFNGSTWTQIGTGISTSLSAAPALTTLSPNRVAYIDATNGDLRVYQFSTPAVWVADAEDRPYLTVSDAGYTSIEALGVNAGLTISAAGSGAFATNGTSSLALTVNGVGMFGGDVEFRGNVGIGTTTPSSKLTVAGDAYITGALYDSTNNAGTAGMVLQSTSDGFQWVATSTLGITSGSLITFGTDNQIPFTNAGGTDFDYSGNFTFDGTNLTVTGNILPGTNLTYDLGSSTKRFKNLWAQTLNVGTSTWSIFNGDGNRLSFSNQAEQGGTEQLTILDNGNVGIGTTTPSDTLTVAGNTSITGNLSLSGLLLDAFGSSGSTGDVLQRSASGLEWVATSSLGINEDDDSILFNRFTSSSTWNAITGLSGTTSIAVKIDVEDMDTGHLLVNVDGRNFATATPSTGLDIVVTATSSVSIQAIDDPRTGADLAVYSGQSTSTANQISDVEDVIFNDDGSKMYLVAQDGSTDYVFAYDLATNFDVTTADYSGENYNVNSQETNPTGMAFNANGSKMYVIGSNEIVYAYNLSTDYDVSSATDNEEVYDVGTECTSFCQGVIFNDTGSRMYIVGGSGSQYIFQYNLSTNFDVSSASYSTSIDPTFTLRSFLDPLLEYFYAAEGARFNHDGSSLFVTGITNLGNSAIVSYPLTPAYDVSDVEDEETTKGVTYINDNFDPVFGVSTGIYLNASSTQVYISTDLTDGPSQTVYTYDLTNTFRNSATAQVIYTDTTGGADLAEYYPVTDTTIKAGDIVAFTDESNIDVTYATADSSLALAGIVSTQPGITLGDGTEGPNKRPIALTGRVPVKVNLENGPVVPGDRITPSSIPGVGMKANFFDRSVGTALTSYDLSLVGTSTSPTSTDAIQQVTVFVKLSDGVDLDVLTDVLFKGATTTFMLPRTDELINSSSTATSTATSTTLVQEADSVSIWQRLADLASRFVDGVMQLAGLMTNQLTVGSNEAPAGITTYDIDTGEPFCNVVRSGKAEIIAGACDDVDFESLTTSDDTTSTTSEESAVNEETINTIPNNDYPTSSEPATGTVSVNESDNTETSSGQSTGTSTQTTQTTEEGSTTEPEDTAPEESNTEPEPVTTSSESTTDPTSATKPDEPTSTQEQIETIDTNSSSSLDQESNNSNENANTDAITEDSSTSTDSSSISHTQENEENTESNLGGESNTPSPADHEEPSVNINTEDGSENRKPLEENDQFDLETETETQAEPEEVTADAEPNTEPGVIGPSSDQEQM